MALSSSIFKVYLNLVNLDHNIYDDLSLTIALHPSETEERMMMRLAAYIISYEPHLEFASGLSNPDEPDLWTRNLMGDVEHWIELGLPDEKKIKKALGRSEKVTVFTYNEHKASTWLEKIKSKIKKDKKLLIKQIKIKDKEVVHRITKRSMNLNALIEDESLFLSDDEYRAEITFDDEAI